MSECQEYLPQLFNQDLIFTFLLLASQPHTNLLFTSQSHFIFIPSTARVRGIQNGPHPESGRVQHRLCRWEGDGTVTGLSPLEGAQGVNSLNQSNYVPRMVPGTLGMTGCKHSPEMLALKPASLAGTLMPTNCPSPSVPGSHPHRRSCSQEPCEAVTKSGLHAMSSRLREVKRFVQCCTAGQCQNWDSEPHLSGSKLVIISTVLCCLPDIFMVDVDRPRDCHTD